MADVEYQVDDRVALITLNRPDVYNALTAAMGGAVNQALRRADADPGVRCVVITGAGRGFCAGADVSLFTDDAALLKDSDPDEGLRPELLMRLRKPVVAAVNGSAAGVGFVLMACADVRFVAEKATLTTSYARLGVSAEYGIGWLLPRLIGLPNALDLLLSAGKISGAEALRLGLAQRALPAPEVLPAALDYARALASG
ncbi:enoyl-CoA hydratase-related protein, partial [Streptomyces sp. NPDC005373]